MHNSTTIFYEQHSAIVLVQHVTVYNNFVKPDYCGFRAIFRTAYGEPRKTGWVASLMMHKDGRTNADSHTWALTKKGAIKKLEEEHDLV